MRPTESDEKGKAPEAGWTSRGGRAGGGVPHPLSGDSASMVCIVDQAYCRKGREDWLESLSSWKRIATVLLPPWPLFHDDMKSRTEGSTSTSSLAWWIRHSKDDSATFPFANSSSPASTPARCAAQTAQAASRSGKHQASRGVSGVPTELTVGPSGRDDRDAGVQNRGRFVRCIRHFGEEDACGQTTFLSTVTPSKLQQKGHFNKSIPRPRENRGNAHGRTGAEAVDDQRKHAGRAASRVGQGAPRVHLTTTTHQPPGFAALAGELVECTNHAVANGGDRLPGAEEALPHRPLLLDQDVAEFLRVHAVLQRRRSRESTGGGGTPGGAGGAQSVASDLDVEEQERERCEQDGVARHEEQ